MKHLFLIILLLLLFLASSCTGSMMLAPQNNVGTAIAGTYMAMTLTAAPTPTPNPNIPNLIGWLNNDLSTVSPLGWTLDAEYHVTNVSFANAAGGMTFSVEVGCICMNNEKCCTPERTFVVVAESMKRNANTVMAQVPGEISNIIVVCSNQQSKEQIGAMTVSWQDMQGYLQGYVSGYQLGTRVTRVGGP